MARRATAVPAIWRPSECVDEIISMPTEEGWDASERCAKVEGLFIGHSGGASIAGALRLANQIERGCIVCILPDRGDRYFTPLKWEKHYAW